MHIYFLAVDFLIKLHATSFWLKLVYSWGGNWNLRNPEIVLDQINSNMIVAFTNQWITKFWLISEYRYACKSNHHLKVSHSKCILSNYSLRQIEGVNILILLKRMKCIPVMVKLNIQQPLLLRDLSKIILICRFCSRNISDYYQCWKQLLTHFSRIWLI